ncbi:pyruvate carboxylase [Ostreibacterium oceani]|uniref:Pyruvate carboxylase n=1 Tax=Ostreibacterium oceani TaxID=2654998 RepID=A0A6N7EYQ9_9GAMM|nr:pyruvate carboxylase [Ostreibacterium oceani]MPV85618.1 pyruvate carboxylase [Ostreibacterium oceani]
MPAALIASAVVSESVYMIKKLLVANRSEIATRIFRSATELGIKTVAIYTYEDRYALHRFKADEAYQIGQPGEPIKNYLAIDAIIAIAKENGVDAIHPGYGFLSENPDFAKACADNGLIFVGPEVSVLTALGDKVSARQLAQAAGLPTLEGSKAAVIDFADAKAIAAVQGYPLLIKAAHGGGGRGMRIVRSEDTLAQQLQEAQSEAKKAFGNAAVFIEKFIEKARHIEIQLLGDKHGNLVHLFERDCSVQRRHQKVIEIAPAPNLDSVLRQQICDAAIRLGHQVGYTHAGTVEFLVDDVENKFYFIEVNPRIQVEHTVTEEVTGLDIVKAQILIASGEKLSHNAIGIDNQQQIATHGMAIQCRVTTEDPENQFMPDYGRIEHYRSASGFGIRLDAGTAFSGAVVYPFYDSLLVKVTARGRHFEEAIQRMERALKEFRVRGVKTNIPFLLKVLAHDTFIQGECKTRFIDQTPELFDFPPKRNRATKLLNYLSETIVNGNPTVVDKPKSKRLHAVEMPQLPQASLAEIPDGLRQRLLAQGPQAFSQWVLSQPQVFITDTTLRDAHQSLLATRLRSHDMLAIADTYARLTPEFFSLEMWGGATFDTAMRFLKECPWQRLTDMRAKVPNVLFQMLLRSSSAVGYANYPDNLVDAFIQESADAGIDVFRVFDALNWLPNLQMAMESVQKTNAICEATICYSGDIIDPKRTKYTLQYYVDLAKSLESMGAHILAIKDMAGLLKPDAATLLIKTLKQEIGIPIHLHTHDTNGMQGATLLSAINADVDIVDAAMAPMSGNTSQPNLNSLVELLRLHPRGSGLRGEAVDKIADYWRCVRDFYTPFDSQSYPATTDLYEHEMPGGQYTNLYQQAISLGLADRWQAVCQMYARVNQLFGDIVKVTPSSKAVGDMALFMVANELTEADIIDASQQLAIPASVKDLISGKMGQPYQGFPEAVQRAILKNEKPLEKRAGALLAPADFAKSKALLNALIGEAPSTKAILSHLMYPQVSEDFYTHQKHYGDTSLLPTPVFFYGLAIGEEIAVDIEQGKTLIIKLIAVGEVNDKGQRKVFYELNGQAREIIVSDAAIEAVSTAFVKADVQDPKQIASQMPGMVVNVWVEAGQAVSAGQKLLSLEAMKMESTISAPVSGTVKSVWVKAGQSITVNELLITLA